MGADSMWIRNLACFKRISIDWAGLTVYFVITDRFCNGDSTNDVNYGRKVDYGTERFNAATFHGGDFKGMLQKAKEVISPTSELM